MSSDLDAGSAGEPKAGTAATPRRPRLLSDQLRFWIALAISVVATFVLAFAFGFVASLMGLLPKVDLHSRAFFFIDYFGFWFIFCASFSLLTFSGFRKVAPQLLDAWLGESARSERRRRLRERLLASGGPVAAVFFAAVAFVAVIIVSVHDDLRGNVIVLVTAVLAVAASWLLIVVAYSTHYARAYANHRGLRFPEADPSLEPQADVPVQPATGPGMGDLFYLSAQVATTFSSSDVEVVSSRMRRVVTGQTLVMFTFNTVIVALLVSVLVSAAG